MRNYFLQNTPFNEGSDRGRQGVLRDFIPELRDLKPNEHPFSGFQYVRQLDTMLIEPPIYLRAMLDDFHLAGGEMVVRELHDVGEVQSLGPSLIFNCTGLGAKALFNDSELVPVRGQLTVLLPQPEVDYAVLQGDFYMFPRTDGIVLGGTHEEGNWSVVPDEATKQRILAGHKKFFDSMKEC
jgi:glycine/D-amino acid oxidase-like deaminating enzyme